MTAPEALPQGSASDYERSAALDETTRGLTVRRGFDINWLTDGSRFWYRVEIAPEQFEFVIGDAEAGTREQAFDHVRLAAELAGAIEAEVDARRLPLTALSWDGEGTQLEFSGWGRRWEYDRETLQLTEIGPTDAAVGSLEPLKVLRPSRGRGPEVHLTFQNRTTQRLELYWVNSAGERRKYGDIAPGEQHRQHTFGGHVWLATNAEGAPIAAYSAPTRDANVVIDGTRRPRIPDGRREQEQSAGRSSLSPDQRWEVRLENFNVHVVRRETGQQTMLTSDGTQENAYQGRVWWSPDSSSFVVLRRAAGERREIHIVESAPDDQLQPRLLTYEYAKPGDKLPIELPHLFDVDTLQQVPLDHSLFANPWSVSRLEWNADSAAFRFLYNQRGHQVLRVLEVTADTGEVRPLIDERSDTFIDYAGKFFLHRVAETGELLWMSERDGWNHLYLYGGTPGDRAQQVTRGEWVVRGVERVDDQQRQVWFRAGGVIPGQDPYHEHLCRVRFDGSELVVLTAGDGTHETEFSPDGRFLVDRWSRVDQPPVTEIRSAHSGQLICRLEEADWSRLLETGWKPPERFVAKGRDGQTDIYGIIVRPSQFDPSRKYPVIEKIYAGPHSAHVPKAFSSQLRERELAELGFIVVQIDGMGTSNRSKAFHDVCWQNLADAGFPDRIRWLRAAAARYPEMDLERLGIYGGSAGGQNALRALLAHGDVYKVAVADCGCHDNRMDKVWWNELWMGWPVGPQYEASSNVTHAHRLQGKLLLIVGELDRNVDPASTMQVVDALVKADRDFQMLVIPGTGHGAAETPYGRRRRQDFFVRHLWGVEPRWSASQTSTRD